MSQAARKNETKTYAGKVERYISGPTADGFAILKLKMPNGTSICAKGKNVLVGFGAGDKVEIKGRETRHPRYGNQVQAFDARIVEEPVDTPDGLTKWLAEAGIEGIGKARAKQISDQLGQNAVERIVRGDALAREVLAKRYDTVREALLSRYGEAKFGPMLTDLGLGRQTRLKVYECFGTETGKVIETEPYRLITEIEGISFLTADGVARKAGLAKNCDLRIMAAACHALRQAEDEGHTWMPINEIVTETAALTDLDPSVIARAFDNGPCPNAVAVNVSRHGGPSIRGWAPQKVAMREEEFARALMQKLKQPKLVTLERAEELVEKHEKKIGITLNAEQREAAIMAIMEPVCVITGGPGRGKTTVLDVIVRAWKELGRRIDLGSPTGKAAQRMREATGIPAQTMHRMLGATQGRFNHNRENPIKADAIGIDETSMLDVHLAAGFSRAWGAAQILFVGDAEQIASVGPGRVFRDMVNAESVPTVRLIENRRQAEGSNIATGAEAICRGEMPAWKDDLQFIECKDNDSIAYETERLFRKYTGENEKVQILTPGHGSEAGTIALNNRLRVKGKDENAVRLAGGAPANVGDEVIQLDNCDDRGIANGDVGRIVAINGPSGSRSVTVEMQTPEGTRRLVYASGQTSELGLAWALTVHKAQGSEYDTVIVPMTTSHWKLLRRSLFNTAVTRSKVRCFVVGQKRAIRQAIAFDDSNLRNSRLEDILSKA